MGVLPGSWSSNCLSIYKHPQHPAMRILGKPSYEKRKKKLSMSSEHTVIKALKSFAISNKPDIFVIPSHFCISTKEHPRCSARLSF